MSASVQRLQLAAIARPGHRFALIDYALAPLEHDRHIAANGVLTLLKLDLAIIVSAEALSVLKDLCGLSIASVTRTAETITDASLHGV